MRHTALWTLVLLGLPGIAVAGGATGVAAQPIFPVGEPAIERPETPAPASPPALDLRIDPTQLPSAQAPNGVRTIEAHRGNRHTAADQGATDRGLSFDVEVKPRSRVGSLAREDKAEDPGLEDELQKLMDRATLGVRGRYRF